ncbi:restriction endonuclease subunit S [Lactiplantibacillus plantarum]|uniref:restriction endonuclease subunit S n=1 Tax=Lactiplantibacillus plantarum TaxID=1590 RepID=UPI0013631399|nr:restriction endonuclease subunit S [Lactiplantibacillus plantarum]MCS8590477.1 restriction endonuclease subunit S [Lactiplantibacillus plantarum]QHM42158.1 hypothetical protein C7M38_00268 [Lactiplantibacillus plantarum]QHM49360.1 hypothetical protein C7M40_01313 [Lactiplantibacillus plantarum]
MKNENLVPKVRFKGFSDPWEQRKLGELGKIQGGGTPDSGIAEYWDGNVNWFTPTEVSNNGYLESSNRKITSLGLKKSSARLMPASTVLITSRAGVGRMGILKYPASTNQGFQSLILNSETDEYFIYSMQPIISKLANRLASGSTFTEISGKQMEKIEIMIPTIGEQNRISSLMKCINNLIAANEDKLEQLKTLKKLMMQKIFSQEWRFKGFTDPWEQRKLGELFNERKEKSSQGELLSVTINSGIVKFDTLDRKNNSSADKSNYRVVRYGDIAYNSMRMWQGASGLSMYNGIVSPAYTVITPRTNTDAGFMAVNFKRKSMIQVFQRNSQGLTSDTWNLKFPVLKNIRISIPKITEQQIITELFTVINNLIAANEDKLNQLKKLKKYLMQNMFV